MTIAAGILFACSLGLALLARNHHDHARRLLIEASQVYQQAVEQTELAAGMVADSRVIRQEFAEQ